MNGNGCIFAAESDFGVKTVKKSLKVMNSVKSATAITDCIIRRPLNVAVQQLLTDGNCSNQATDSQNDIC